MINKKHIILFIFLLHLITPQLFSNNKNLLLSKTFDELLIELDSAVNFRKNFVQKHENKIIQTKEQETTTDSALLVKYEKLIGLYYFYQSDSCIHYINRAINLLESANQSLHSKTAKQKIHLLLCQKAAIYGMSGLPDKARILLDSIRQQTTDAKVLRQVYCSYFDVSDFFYGYRLSPDLISKDYQILESLRDSLKKYQTESSDFDMRLHSRFESEEAQIQRFIEKIKQNSKDIDKGSYAVIISNKYQLISKEEERNRFWAISAIYNLKACRMDNEALIRLANLLYEKNDLQRASSYLEAAKEQAIFYNARSRIMEIFPLIDRELTLSHKKIKQQQLYLRISLSLLIVITILLFLYIGYTYKKKVSDEQESRGLNQEILQLSTENKMMAETLAKKTDALTHFLEISIDALFDQGILKNNLINKIKTNDTKGISNILKNTANQKRMLQRFDFAFCKLYPDFIKQVNKLLLPENVINLAEDELLNNELRIVAFSKLGITDCQRIAIILDISVNTVYFYKNRLKNRARNKETFDTEIQKI